MAILSEIKDRRSIRKYKSVEVTDELLNELLTAAFLAPSGSNEQPWDFIIVKSKEMKEKICQADHNQKWMLQAPVFIVCIGKSSYRKDGSMERTIRDCSIAIAHLLLQAQHLGLGTCWTGWYEQDEIRNLLGLTSEDYVTGIITVGYADESPAARPRRTLSFKVI